MFLYQNAAHVLFYFNISIKHYFMFLIALIPDTTSNSMGNFVFTKIIRFELKRDENICYMEVRDGIYTKKNHQRWKYVNKVQQICWSKNECFGDQVNRKRHNENNNKPTPYLFAFCIPSLAGCFILDFFSYRISLYPAHNNSQKKFYLLLRS